MFHICFSSRSTVSSFLLALLLSLGACGGGGGSTAAAPGTTPRPAPTSGTYAWLPKAQGSTGALTKGLSLVHPAEPSVEFVIEPASAAVTDAVTIASGAVDTTALVTQTLRPAALVYIVGGDVRMVPLDANGAGPATRVLRAGSTSACAFQTLAIDHASPFDSRFIVSTAGADGQCSTTTDNGSAEVVLSATDVRLVPISGAAPLDVMRDTTTLAPRGWLYGKVARLWSDGSTFATRQPAERAVTSVVASTCQSALVDDGVQLGVLDFGAGSTVTSTLLDPVATSGGGWQSIGYDAANFYAYRNSTTDVSTSVWTVLKVTRTAPVASVLASGNGFLSVASMGRSLLYVTTIGPDSATSAPDSGNRLLSIGKAAAPATPATVLAATPSTTLTTVQTSAGAVHQLWRVSNIGAPPLAYAVEMIDEAGATRYSSGAGGFPMGMQEAEVQRFDVSESRTRFVFATGYGERAYGDANLVAYDTTAGTATAIGTLPGRAVYGNDFVFANVQAGPGAVVAGYAARSSGGIVQDSGSDVFMFDIGRAGSIVHTSVKQ